MAKIELDVAYGSDIGAYASKFGCTYRVIAEVGPAGGNPLVEFQGTRAQLEALVEDYDGSNGDADWIKESIVD